MLNIAHQQEVQIKARVRHTSRPSEDELTRAGEDVAGGEPCAVSEKVKWWHHYRKTRWCFLKQLKLELPYDPAFPLGIYSEEMKILIRKDICTPMVHSSTIYHVQDMEITYVSIDRWMDQ